MKKRQITRLGMIALLLMTILVKFPFDRTGMALTTDEQIARRVYQQVSPAVVR